MLERNELLMIRPGDRLVFKAATRSGCRKATRVVTGTPAKPTILQPEGCFTVKQYHGWQDFVVKPHEILGWIPRDEQDAKETWGNETWAGEDAPQFYNER